jgi:hypothetical protein
VNIVEAKFKIEAEYASIASTTSIPPIDQVTFCLCEDFKTVMVTAYFGGHDASAVFDLPDGVVFDRHGLERDWFSASMTKH